MSKLRKAYSRSNIPLYIQISSLIRQRIESGQWRLGQKIPTLVELEREFQVARVTVRQAVEILREEGLLHCHQGRGTFVAEKTSSRHWVKVATDWNVLVASIKENVLLRIKVNDPPAKPSLAENEGELAQEYIFIRSLQFKNNQPYGLVNVHLAKHIYERDPEQFAEHPALSVLTELDDIGVQHAHQTMVIGSADLEKADLLKIAVGAPTAECRCVIIDEDGVAIYVADITYRSDAVKLYIDLFANSRPAIGSGPGRKSMQRGSESRDRNTTPTA